MSNTHCQSSETISEAYTQQLIQRFDRLLQDISNSAWKQALVSANRLLNIKLYNLDKLTPNKIKQLYQTLVHKFYKEEKSKNSWHQNQLRIFVWVLITFSYSRDKSPDQFNSEEWQVLCNVFRSKSVELCLFQFNSLKRNSEKSRPWNVEEDNLLISCFNEKEIKNKWNQIAKEIFTRSDQKYFRTAKQCRERWNNYLDPLKIHGRWTQEEDLKLIKSVLQKGKKWSAIAKDLNNTRTEHMVKNRYKSLLAKQLKKDKKNKKNCDQSVLLEQIERRLFEDFSSSKEIEKPEISNKPIIQSLFSSSSAFSKIQKKSEIFSIKQKQNISHYSTLSVIQPQNPASIYFYNNIMYLPTVSYNKFEIENPAIAKQSMDNLNTKQLKVVTIISNNGGITSENERKDNDD